MGSQKMQDGHAFLIRIQATPNIQTQVGTVKTTYEDFTFGDIQLIQDIKTSYFICCRGKSNNRYIQELFPKNTKLTVFRSKVMSPL